MNDERGCPKSPKERREATTFGGLPFIKSAYMVIANCEKPLFGQPLLVKMGCSIFSLIRVANLF
jgi:hypothetical protein